jgi:hypothetical protein
MTERRRFIENEVTPNPMDGLSTASTDLSDVNTTLDEIAITLKETLLEGDVLVISGANSQAFPVASRRVGDVRQELQFIMNIGPNAVALVNGTAAAADHVLRQDDTLEFTREGGEKGSRNA